MGAGPGVSTVQCVRAKAAPAQLTTLLPRVPKVRRMFYIPYRPIIAPIDAKLCRLTPEDKVEGHAKSAVEIACPSS